MAILLLGGTITPVLSQSVTDAQIIINEVEVNPTGSDAGIGVGGIGNQSKLNEGSSGSQEYVELYNPTDQSVDIGGWHVTPNTSWKSFQIPNGTIIEPKSFVTVTHVNFWFNNFGDQISLYDDSDNLIDQTPILVDELDNSLSWQRNFDGLDTDSDSDWILKIMNPNSSNGIESESEENIFSFSGEINKNLFIFGETLVISGKISELQYINNDLITPETVKVHVSGPGYNENIELFPNRTLEFSTSLSIQKIFGFSLGEYEVEIRYGDNLIEKTFSLVNEEELETSEIVSETLSIYSDKSSYIPGELVTIRAETNSQIELAGLDYVVSDPNGKQIAGGTIFPNSEFSTVFAAGGGQIFPFSTQFIMQTVNPVFGTYTVDGIFQSQNPLTRSSDESLSATITFELIEDIKEDVAISLSTDKTIYEIDEIVKISGRSNDVWTEDLELHIMQTGTLIRNDASDGPRYQALSPFDEKYDILLNGDGTFEYDFKIPASTDSQIAYGDYLIKVSEYFGQATQKITVVPDSESFVDIRTPLGLKTDKSQYVLGTALNLYGTVLNYENKQSNNARNFVTVTFTDPNGNKLMSEDRSTSFNDYGKSPNAPLTLTAVPDSIGNFNVGTVLNPIQFDYGVYTINAFHVNSNSVEKIEFEIVSAQSEILDVDTPQEPISFQLCSSTGADLDDILKDTKQIGKGEIPPSMESINCEIDNNFNTGEKLVIIGKVAYKDPRSLDQSSVKTSGHTESGSSYSTNYAQAEFNYVELSIPYPQSLKVSTSYRTIPDAGEDYHGGGGSGGGGVMHGGDDGSGTGVGCGRGGEDFCKYESDSNKSTGYDGQAILREKIKQLTGMTLKAYPDSDGNFAGIFDLRAGVFSDGVYNMKANYYGYNAQELFTVNDSSLKGGLEPEIVLDINKNEYLPGETVFISGKIKNVYYYDLVSMSVNTPDVSKINCLVGQQCGSENTAKKLRVTESVDGATFYMNYAIPSDISAIGKYTIIADTHFGESEKSFFVISESESFSAPPSESSVKKFISKFNRISDSNIPINLSEKNIEDKILEPRVLQGSLITSARGEESDVNLRIITSNGQCVIGQESDCLVSESTRKPGQIYSVVSIDDIDYKIRYSGHDVRLEKFSIVPADSNTSLDIDVWNVEIIKDEQPSRFYYKVSHIASE
tara:strand:- start:1645 stop:5139 length:3495 start_codon:yes stop_codon:yes gene_type:complete